MKKDVVAASKAAPKEAAAVESKDDMIVESVVPYTGVRKLSVTDYLRANLQLRICTLQTVLI